MACGYLAGRYVEAMAFHDELLGAKQVATKNIKSPRQLAYALCLLAIGQGADSDDDLILAGHRVLQQNLAERWLHLGSYQRAAEWLKIVHELANPGLPPDQVLLKAYDDMPTVAKPAFLNGAQGSAPATIIPLQAWPRKP